MKMAPWVVVALPAEAAALLELAEVLELAPVEVVVAVLERMLVVDVVV